MSQPRYLAAAGSIAPGGSTTAAPARYIPAATAGKAWAAEASRLLPPWVSLLWDGLKGSAYARLTRCVELRVWDTGAPDRPWSAQLLETTEAGEWVRAATTWGASVELALGRMAQIAPAYGVQLPIGADRPHFHPSSTETSA